MKPILLRLLVLVPALLAGAAFAQQPVGRVLLSAGDTFAVRNGQQVRLQYNSPVEFKDTLRTGAASSLQVRFNDESLLSLRENTDFAIEDYQFAGGDDSRERAFFRLIKGGFRSVTGLIGRARNANYRVQTQTATIGIRGTDYSARECRGDCGAGVKDGLYGTVNGISGGTNQITLQNEGTPQPSSFGINQHFYVPDAKSAPQPLLQPPSFVSIRPQGKAQAAQQGGSGTGGEQSSASSGAQAESRPSTTVEPVVSAPLLPFRQVETFTEGGTLTALATLPTANGFGAFYPVGASFEGLFDDTTAIGTFNGQNHLTGYQFGTGPAAGSLGGGTITDTGSITTASGQVFTWGRWTGPTQVTTKAGTSLSDAPLLFITGSDVQGGLEAKFIGGQGTYTFIGGPKPVDAAGNTGTVTSSSLGINFTTQTATYALGMSFPAIGSFGSATFSLSGSGGFSSGSNTGEFHGSLSGSCSGGGCGSPSVFGAFDVGLAGPNGYDFAVVGGGVTNATQAGSVVFLNNYSVSSFTAGPLPMTGTTGQIAYFALPSNSGVTFTLSSNLTQTSGADLIGFSSPNSTLVGSLGTGSVVDRGSVTLADLSVMNWGRWAGPGLQVTDTGNGVAGIDQVSGLPFVIGTSNGTIPTSGTFSYSLAGGAAASPSVMASGTIISGTAVISFGATNSIALSSLIFSVPSSGTATFTLSGTSSFTGGVISNISLSGQCVGGSCATFAPATGSAAGILIGQQAAGLALAGTASAGISVPNTFAVFGAAFKR